VHLHQREEFDAVVVGSGVSGGWAAKELTEKGLRTLVLERGRPLEHKAGYRHEHTQSWEFPLRNRHRDPDHTATQKVQARIPWLDEAALLFYQDDTEHPYVEDKPFTWIQGGTVGGVAALGAGTATAGATSTSRPTCATATASTGRSATPTSRPGTRTSSASRA
jgi:choline dehydrogenase-like flavoprotein